MIPFSSEKTMLERFHHPPTERVMIFFLCCHACWALTHSLTVCIQSLKWSRVSKLRSTLRGENCPFALLFLRYWCSHKWEWTSLCPLGQTRLPLQMLASGHSLSSTSSPGHWISSSLVTGRPESRSKQAWKRFWIETNCEPLTAADKVLLCREDGRTQGEQGVQPDHSLRTTERQREAEMQVNGIKFSRRVSFHFHWALLPSHSLMSHCKLPLWHRLEEKEVNKRDNNDNLSNRDRVHATQKTNCHKQVSNLKERAQW